VYYLGVPAVPVTHRMEDVVPDIAEIHPADPVMIGLVKTYQAEMGFVREKRG